MIGRLIGDDWGLIELESGRGEKLGGGGIRRRRRRIRRKGGRIGRF